jgi:hypothetical protein
VIIVCAVRWYLRYSLSYRDVEELVTERGLSVDHTTMWRWVQQYAPELNQRCRRELKPTNGSWRVVGPDLLFRFEEILEIVEAMSIEWEKEYDAKPWGIQTVPCGYAASPKTRLYDP